MENEFYFRWNRLYHFCSQDSMAPVWYPSETTFADVIGGCRAFTCIYCSKKVPDHLIIQWKLLNE